jgi:hypothetical protein
LTTTPVLFTSCSFAAVVDTGSLNEIDTLGGGAVRTAPFVGETDTTSACAKALSDATPLVMSSAAANGAVAAIRANVFIVDFIVNLMVDFIVRHLLVRRD